MTTHEKKSVCIERCRGKEVHRAGWIICDASTIIENGYIEVEKGIIQGIGKGTRKGSCIDHGPGIIMPALVNAHLHLELSALKNRLPFDRGFKFWVETLLETRGALGEETLVREAQKAAAGLVGDGNLYVGDISTLGIMRPVIEHSGLMGVFFHEYLGTKIPPFFTRKEDAVSFSIAGHAPHSTSPELLQALKQRSRSDNLPFSIHVAESDEESEFIRDKKGAWADFLSSRGIDWSSWGVGAKTPIAYLDDMAVLDPLTIVVHALNMTEKDMKTLARSRSKVCVCPRSNWNLHGKLPDIEKMIQKGIQPALGTDSLASCESLNIFDEMVFVSKHYPGLDPQAIFSMATINGARALGLERNAGSLSTGKQAQFLYRPVNIKNKKDLFQRILSNE